MKIILLAEIALITAFLWCGWQADNAMDKSGIGNLGQCQQYNGYASIAFYSAVAMWISSILISLLSKRFKDKTSQVAIGLPPLLLILGWLAMFIGE